MYVSVDTSVSPLLPTTLLLSCLMPLLIIITLALQKDQGMCHFLKFKPLRRRVNIWAQDLEQKKDLQGVLTKKISPYLAMSAAGQDPESY